MRKSVTVRENKSRSKEYRTSLDDASPVAEDFKPEDVRERERERERESTLVHTILDNLHALISLYTYVQHLNIFQAHKRNVFEINLPNKVTKILAVPPRGTVKDAIQPVLKKQGYSFDIMELRFANNFRVSIHERERASERERESMYMCRGHTLLY